MSVWTWPDRSASLCLFLCFQMLLFIYHQMENPKIEDVRDKGSTWVWISISVNRGPIFSFTSPVHKGAVLLWECVAFVCGWYSKASSLSITLMLLSPSVSSKASSFSSFWKSTTRCARTELEEWKCKVSSVYLLYLLCVGGFRDDLTRALQWKSNS